MKRESQTSFNFRSHGGARNRAGRRKHRKSEARHEARPEIDEKNPLHINFKLMQQVPSLRTPKFMMAFARIIAMAKRSGLYIHQYTIESNHIHLIAEAESKDALKRGMLSITTAITWALRRIFRFFGKVFLTRYHLEVIKSPTQMRNTLRYVLFNHSKHTNSALFADVYSSVFDFEDWETFAPNLKFGPRPKWFNDIVAEICIPRSWLQSVGWKRAKAPLRSGFVER